MKVMTWNVLFGGEGRFPAILDVIAAEQPDLLFLQECLGWEDGARLGEVARVMGAVQVHLGRARARASGRRFHIGVASRLPFRPVCDHLEAPIAHCLVELELGSADPLTVLVAHLNAGSEDRRLEEARHAVALVGDGLASRRYLLAGDLNAISAADPYPPDLARCVREGGLDKYGHPPRFEVMAELAAAGWVDALRERPLGPEWVTAPPGPRRPLGFRTDYVLCSPPLAADLEGARVVDVGAASDHNAVVAFFREPRP